MGGGQPHVDRALEPGRGMGGNGGVKRGKLGQVTGEREGLTIETGDWLHTQIHGINEYIKNHKS